MGDKGYYDDILAFNKRTESEALQLLNDLSSKWIQCNGENEYYACSIAMLHMKLNHISAALSFLSGYVDKHENKLLAKCLLADLFFQANHIDTAIKYYEQIIGDDYSNGQIVRKYVWCLHNKSFYKSLSDVDRGYFQMLWMKIFQRVYRLKVSRKLLKIINHVLRNHVYEIGVEDLHLNIHIATKIIRDAQRDAIQRGIPPVVLMSSGCAASTATLSMLSQRLGTGGVALQYQNRPIYLVEEAVNIFSRGGLITRIQTTLSHGNVREILLKYGLRKIVCIIRDPRECIISYYRMILQFQCFSDQEQIRGVLAEHDKDIVDQFRFFMDFVSDCLRETNRPDSKFNILFMNFNEWRIDPIAYIKKIVDFYDIPDRACLTPYDQLSGNRRENASNRSNIVTAWQDFLPLETAEKVENLMPVELINTFKWSQRVFNT